MSKQFVPVDLPTEGRVYPAKTIEVRAFTVEEVKRLQPILKRNDVSKMLTLLNECVRGIDVRDLTTGDLWYLLAYLRVNTFQHTPLLRAWVCPKKACRATNTMEVVLPELKIVPLPPEFVEPAYLHLDVCDKDVPLRLRRAGSAVKAEEYLATLHNRAPTEDEVVEVELAMTIATTPDFPDLTSKIDFLRTLDPEDYLLLQDFQSAYSHGIPNQIPGKCKECGHETNRVHMYFHPGELIPSGASRDRVRNAVHFRVETAGDRTD